MSFSELSDLDARSPDETLHYGAAPEQFMSVWRPQRASLATLILLHGGCWSNEYDLTHTGPVATALADAGYIVWSVEYRRVGDAGGGWPGSLEDAEEAVRVIANQTAARPVILLGHSAGGHLALLLGAGMAKHAEPIVDAVVALSPIARLARYGAGDNSCQKMVRRFMGGQPADLPDAYRCADPVNLTPHPLTVVLSGEADTIVPSVFSDLDGASRVMVAGVGHFDWLHSGTAAFNTLQTTLRGIVDGP